MLSPVAAAASAEITLLRLRLAAAGAIAARAVSSPSSVGFILMSNIGGVDWLSTGSSMKTRGIDRILYSKSASTQDINQNRSWKFMSSIGTSRLQLCVACWAVLAVSCAVSRGRKHRSGVTGLRIFKRIKRSVSRNDIRYPNTYLLAHPNNTVNHLTLA